MKYLATTEAEAQAAADKMHQHLIATSPAYAESVRLGHTKRWSQPLREVDDKGQPIGDWYVPVEGKCVDALSSAEHEKLDSDGKAFIDARKEKL